ncbi:hypothetical protein D3C74_311760 [compost metagenome]
MHLKQVERQLQPILSILRFIYADLHAKVKLRNKLLLDRPNIRSRFARPRIDELLTSIKLCRDSGDQRSAANAYFATCHSRDALLVIKLSDELDILGEYIFKRLRDEIRHRVQARTGGGNKRLRLFSRRHVAVRRSVRRIKHARDLLEHLVVIIEAVKDRAWDVHALQLFNMAHTPRGNWEHRTWKASLFLPRTRLRNSPLFVHDAGPALFGHRLDRKLGILVLEDLRLDHIAHKAFAPRVPFLGVKRTCREWILAVIVNIRLMLQKYTGRRNVNAMNPLHAAGGFRQSFGWVDPLRQFLIRQFREEFFILFTNQLRQPAIPILDEPGRLLVNASIKRRFAPRCVVNIRAENLSIGCCIILHYFLSPRRPTLFEILQRFSSMDDDRGHILQVDKVRDPRIREETP